MRYIESDKDGNIIHISEIHFPDNDPGEEYRAALAEDIKARSEAQGNKFLRISVDEEVSHTDHKHDHDAEKIRTLTSEEIEWRDGAIYAAALEQDRIERVRQASILEEVLRKHGVIK